MLWAQQPTITMLNQERNSSYRGLSVVDDQTIWVSGSNGTVGLSGDGGRNWQWVNPIGYEKTDFRDIEAFDENHALVISAGSPAIILSTDDGGRSWREVFSDKRPEIFYDGFAFTAKGTGIAFGDAINGKMPLLKTADFGKTWNDISSNLAYNITAGEAGFAASGTSIYCNDRGNSGSQQVAPLRTSITVQTRGNIGIVTIVQLFKEKIARALFPLHFIHPQ